MTPDSLRRELEVIRKKLKYGCGNHGCRIKKPTGMGTNAGCNCTPKRISKLLLELAAEAEGQGNEWVIKEAENTVMAEKEHYTVDEKNEPSLHYSLSPRINSVKRGVSGWFLLDYNGVKMNFIPDGTEWIRPRKDNK